MGDNEKEIENKEIHDSFGERFKALLSSFKRDDLTNVDIYNKIYGNKNIDDSSKKNKISNLRNGKTVTLDDLIAISHTFDISLDWLVFGKEESPAQNEAKKTALDKAEESNNFFTDYEYISLLQSYEETEDKEETALVESLLDNERPVLQMCASFLYLLSYANISLIGDYDINNMDMPQSLTIKITPKSFWKYGYFDENNQKFIFTYKSRNPRLLIWDFRATLLQRFIALALDQQKNFVLMKKHYLNLSFGI